MNSGSYSQERFDAMPIVGILRGFYLDEVLQIMDICVSSGITNVEITMNTEGVEEQIAQCLNRYGDRLNVGAGTVCDMDELHMALDAGAQFIVTPITDVQVIHYCKENDIPVFPGAMTPTEIVTAWRAGASMIKLFPAETMGPGYMKTLKGPLSQIPIMPTGGVDPDNLAEWHAAGAKAYGVGGKLFNKKMIRDGDWEGVFNLAESFVTAYKNAVTNG